MLTCAMRAIAQNELNFRAKQPWCDNEVGVAISIRDPYTSPGANDSLAVFYWSAVYTVKP